ncbi:unnamed protein product [Protopolystoma xenopodis]|uniref:Uncharacterized protein n=1 Tax=Protopolystoma xenopodis TaxID=117903 RepID=A0A3S5BSN9_9PLAT|nr:unnamed protein product [Protopolystoma xenopodis]
MVPLPSPSLTETRKRFPALAASGLIEGAQIVIQFNLGPKHRRIVCANVSGTSSPVIHTKR